MRVMFNQLINLLLIQGEIIDELKKENGILEKTVDNLESDVNNLNDKIIELREKVDAISAVKELLPIAEEIGQPGEYGSLKQRAWDAYHKHKSWEVW